LNKKDIIMKNTAYYGKREIMQYVIKHAVLITAASTDKMTLFRSNPTRVLNITQ
jgi:hypothetical protein